MTTPATPRPNSVHATLGRRELLILYSWIFSTKAPNAGLGNAFDKLLDRFTMLGLYPSDDGQQIFGGACPEIVEIDFDKRELMALKFVLSLRLRPNPQSEYQISHGMARTMGWPLAESLGVARGLKAELLPKEEKSGEDLKLDSEYEAEELAAKDAHAKAEANKSKGDVPDVIDFPDQPKK